MRLCPKNFLVVLSVFTFAVVFLCHAQKVDKNLLKKKKDDISRIRKELKEKERIIDELKSKEGSILSVLDRIGSRLHENRKRLKQARKDKGILQKEIAQINLQVAGLNGQVNSIKISLAERLRMSYKMGKAGFLKVLVSAQGYSDLMRKRYYLESIIRAEDDLLTSFYDKEKTLRSRMDELERKKRDLSSLSENISRKLDDIQRDKRGKVAVLRAVKGEKELEIKRAKELASAARDLETMIKKIKRSDVGRAANFVLSKGSMPLPANGKIVRGYGKYYDKDLKVSMLSKGMTIDAKPQSPVRCIFDGKVIFAGSFKGYGNMLIVDHGGNYYSLYARLDSLGKRLGEKVKRGEEIGDLSDSEEIYGGGLYFELRHNGIPIDPSPWLLEK